MKKIEMKKYNKKSIIAGLIVTILGILMILCEIYWWETSSKVWINIGCSLIASALVILLNAFLVDAQIFNPLSEWKLKMITSTRAEINSDCELEMEHAKHQVDIIAFGLRSFRTTHTEKQILAKLKKGVNYRILTMDPNSGFVNAREIEEKNKNIKDSIVSLVEWANKLNNKSLKGKIIIKGYSAMTIDFYWRVDDVAYIGPYWYGYESQQTITYKYIKGGKGFKTYSDYFEKLWESDELTVFLTQKTSARK